MRHSMRAVGAAIDRMKADPLRRRAKLLQEHGITVVLDVGANTGQYGRALRRLGYRGRIVSFEPLSTAFAKLQRAAAKDRRWEAHRLAFGDRDGTATLNVSGDSRASSLLQMLPAHRNVAGYFATVGQEQVPLRRLDAVFSEHVGRADRAFLKLDVQGLEPKVLAGASRSMGRIAGVQIELSLAPLYRGEVPMTRMLGRLERAGFELMSLEYGFCDPKTGRMLQVDGVLFRPSRRAQAGAGTAARAARGRRR